MKRLSLRLKLTLVGMIAVLVPLLAIGGVSIFMSGKALGDAAQSQSREVARGLAYMIDSTLQEEMKIVSQTAQREAVIDAAAAYAGGAKEGPLAAKATAELTAMVQRSGTDYEVVYIVGLDGKVIADGQGGKYVNKGIDLSQRDYFQEAKNGKVNVGSVVTSKATGNVVLTFAAPVYSRSNQIIGVVGSTMGIGFLTGKVSETKLGKTGYGFVIEKTGLCIAHPNKDMILKVNTAQTEGMKSFSARMIAGETGAEAYFFKGVQKMAGYAPVPASGWSVGITQDYNEFMTPTRNLTFIIVLMGVAFLIITLTVVFLMNRSIALPINYLAGDLDDASDQVAAASAQVASAGQQLAEGSSEQASALEETSSSLEEMSSMTRQNADNAAQAMALMAEARKIVEKVDHQMNNMVTAISDVAKSSEETGKIIKTIDEIAFQTNLLALNAAVEAARAGEAGAGFAVVADEVRNLAMRAADAAKNTSSLIENTIATVRNSRELTQQTQEAFRENREITGKVGHLVDEIAAASSEQAQGIGQIGKAVAEMDKVVQQTAANAEESASAAEEMNAQALQMKQYVARLSALVAGEGGKMEDPDEETRTRKSGRPALKKFLTAGADLMKPRRLERPQPVIIMEKSGMKGY